MWYAKREGLEFRAPVKLKRLAREAQPRPRSAPVAWEALDPLRIWPSDRRLPAGPGETQMRNALVWFLLAAGVPTREVAELFELSASRCLSISTRCAEKYRCYRRRSPFHKVEPAVEKAHRLGQDMREMLVAEELLEDDRWQASVAYCLNLGREHFRERVGPGLVATCTCEMCTGRLATSAYTAKVYWMDGESLGESSHTTEDQGCAHEV